MGVEYCDVIIARQVITNTLGLHSSSHSSYKGHAPHDYGGEPSAWRMRGQGVRHTSTSHALKT